MGHGVLRLSFPVYNSLLSKRTARAPELRSLGFKLGIVPNEVWVVVPKISAKIFIFEEILN